MGAVAGFQVPCGAVDFDTVIEKVISRSVKNANAHHGSASFCDPNVTVKMYLQVQFEARVLKYLHVILFMLHFIGGFSSTVI